VVTKGWKRKKSGGVHGGKRGVPLPGPGWLSSGETIYKYGGSKTLGGRLIKKRSKKQGGYHEYRFADSVLKNKGFFVKGGTEDSSRKGLQDYRVYFTELKNPVSTAKFGREPHCT